MSAVGAKPTIRFPRIDGVKPETTDRVRRIFICRRLNPPERAMNRAPASCPRGGCCGPRCLCRNEHLADKRAALDLWAVPLSGLEPKVPPDKHPSLAGGAIGARASSRLAPGNEVRTAQFELLRSAYIDARDSPHYKISSDELESLGERIAALRAVVQELCMARLEALGTA